MPQSREVYETTIGRDRSSNGGIWMCGRPALLLDEAGSGPRVRRLVVKAEIGVTAPVAQWQSAFLVRKRPAVQSRSGAPKEIYMLITI